MTYTVINNTAHINGRTGEYDGVVKDPVVRYTRNALSNYYKTYRLPEPSSKDEFIFSSNTSIEDFERFADMLDNDLKNAPPIKFELKYSPSNQLNQLRKALTGAAYEEIQHSGPYRTSGRTFIPVAEMTTQLQKDYKIAHPDASPEKISKITAEPLDTDNSGDIGTAEMAAYIAAKDMLGAHDSNLSPDNLTGTITNAGDIRSLALLTTLNKDNAKNVFTQIQADLKLNEAMREFLSDLNNLEPPNNKKTA